MKINCPRCGHPAKAKDINFQKGMVTCTRCTNLYLLSGAYSQMKKFRLPKTELGPSGIKVQYGENVLNIEIEWLLINLGWLSHIFHGFFLIGVAFFLNYVLIKVGQQTNHLWLVFFVLGIFVLFRGFFCLINTTNIYLGKNYIELTNYPINFWGWKNYRIRVKDVRQLFIKEHKSRKSDSDPESGYTYSYSLRLKSKKGEIITLLNGFKSATQAYFIERKIEEYLEIKDQEMIGGYISDPPIEIGIGFVVKRIFEMSLDKDRNNR